MQIKTTKTWYSINGKFVNFMCLNDRANINCKYLCIYIDQSSNVFFEYQNIFSAF